MKDIEGADQRISRVTHGSIGVIMKRDWVERHQMNPRDADTLRILTGGNVGGGGLLLRGSMFYRE